MPKQKAPTAQEIYRQRKQREERERSAYLPPGLINHGNTCFMNSVLQGLLATSLLSDLVQFQPVPKAIQAKAATPIIARRSPQLTNGHNLAGPDDQPWINTMPIGDTFLSILFKGWEYQSRRQRDILSPRPLLTTLGQKYDQYLDFAQQDAHEFLRILLDAMRMEEQDVIKKRQPPAPPKEQGRRGTASTAITRADDETPAPEPTPNPVVAAPSTDGAGSHTTHGADEEPLLSFVDMLFGGQLTSILVCQKCKHVSQSYEPFNDISLSLKAEDYYGLNSRKRDKLKKLAKKIGEGMAITMPGASAPKEKKEKPREPETKEDSPAKEEAPAVVAPVPTLAPTPISVAGLEIKRSSSVPPSPSVERPGEIHDVDGAVIVSTLRRRRSLDFNIVRKASERQLQSEEVAAHDDAVDGDGDDEGFVTPDESRTPDEQPPTITVERDGKDVEEERDSDSSHVIVNVTGPEDRHVEFFEPKDKPTEADPTVGVKAEEEPDKPKQKDEASWAKIGRRISMTVGFGALTRSKQPTKDKKERERKSRSMDTARSTLKEEETEPAPPALQKSASNQPTTNPSASSASLASTSASDRFKKPLPPRPNSSVQHVDPASVPVASPPPVPPLTMPQNPTVIFAKSSRPSTPSASSSTTPLSLFPNVLPQRSKSPKPIKSKPQKPPKPSAAEAEYLRRILADIGSPSLAGASSVSNHFPLFKSPALLALTAHHDGQQGSPSHSQVHLPHVSHGGVEGAATKSSTALNATSWLGLGVGANPSGIEECLRLFTAVEVLDGENMVGCRRCWKIENGVLGRKIRNEDDEPDSDEENESTPPARPHLPTSISTASISHASQSTTTKTSTDDSQSVSSVPTTATSVTDDKYAPSKSRSPLHPQPSGPGGLPIPVISTTAPPSEEETDPSASDLSSRPTPHTDRDSAYRRLIGTVEMASSPPLPAQAQKRVTQNVYRASAPPTSSKDSLVIPQVVRKRPAPGRKNTFDSSVTATTEEGGTTTNTSDDDMESDTSASSRQERGGTASPTKTIRRMSVPLGSGTSSGVGTAIGAGPPPGATSRKSKAPKPVIMRPAYKRYLIATPPPVLVIHLKRFQQTLKTPFMSLSHGFKKLDDYVSFPEYFDLTPYLAPKKEDFGLGKKGKESSRRKHEKSSEDKCVYRLYAVVVHIGNMLGGHYVSYTALPDRPPIYDRRPAPAEATSPPRAASSPPNPSAAPTVNASAPSAPQSTSSLPSAPSGSKTGERQWAFVSDTVVRLTTLEEVLNAKAYICMYERVI